MDLHIQVWKTHILVGRFSILKEEFCYIVFHKYAFTSHKLTSLSSITIKKIHRFNEKIDDSFDVIKGLLYVIVGMCDVKGLHTLKRIVNFLKSSGHPRS